MIPVGDVGRAAAVAAAAGLAGWVWQPLAATGRRGAWILLLAPYLAPSLLVGYAYSNFALALIHHPALNALAYSLLLCLKLAPLAALALHLAPRPLSDSALHCARLAHGSAGWRFRWQAGCARAPLAAFALVLLLAFNEFEMASLMNVKTWTVRLFDAQAGGLPLARTLALAAGPFAIALLVVACVLGLLAGQHWARHAETERAATAAGKFAWGLLLAANLLVWGIPAAVVLHGTVQGWRVLATSFALGREIGTSLLLGAVAAAAAYAVAPRRGWAAAAASLPGLLGPLALALLLTAALQTPWLHRWRDVPAPLAIALALYLLPAAALLRQLLRTRGPATAVHAARILGGAEGRQIVWRLATRRHVWAAFLLLCLAYLELTISAILAPTGVTPVSVRLYNLMHYGQTAVLSAMLAAAFAAPALALAAADAIRRIWVRL